MIIENPHQRYPMDVDSGRRREAEAYTRRRDPKPGPPQPGTPWPGGPPEPDGGWPRPSTWPMWLPAICLAAIPLTGWAGGNLLLWWAG